MLEATGIAILWQELCLQTTADSPSVRQILVERPDGTPYACGDHLEVMPKNSGHPGRGKDVGGRKTTPGQTKRRKSHCKGYLDSSFKSCSVNILLYGVCVCFFFPVKTTHFSQSSIAR